MIGQERPVEPYMKLTRKLCIKTPLHCEDFPTGCKLNVKGVPRPRLRRRTFQYSSIHVAFQLARQGGPATEVLVLKASNISFWCHQISNGYGVDIEKCSVVWDPLETAIDGIKNCQGARVPGAKICIMYARNLISELSPQLGSE